MAASYVLNNILRGQGCAFYAMFGLTAGGVLNIALDPLFIFALGMGTGGAALATILSQLIGFVILLFMVQRHGEVRIRFSFIERSWRTWRDILYTGMPSFWRQGLASHCLDSAQRLRRPRHDRPGAGRRGHRGDVDRLAHLLVRHGCADRLWSGLPASVRLQLRREAL